MYPRSGGAFPFLGRGILSLRVLRRSPLRPSRIRSIVRDRASVGSWYRPSFASEAILCARTCNPHRHYKSRRVENCAMSHRVGGRLSTLDKSPVCVRFASLASADGVPRKSPVCVRFAWVASADRVHSLTQAHVTRTASLLLHPKASRRGIERMKSSEPFSANTRQALGLE